MVGEVILWHDDEMPGHLSFRWDVMRKYLDWLYCSNQANGGGGGNEWIWSFGPLISVAVPPLGPPSSLLCSRQRLFNGMIFILCPIYGAYVNKGNECRVCRSELKVTVRDILVSLISRTTRARHFWGLGYESCLCQVPPMGANLWAEIALPVCHLPQSCFSV